MCSKALRRNGCRSMIDKSWSHYTNETLLPEERLNEMQLLAAFMTYGHNPKEILQMPAMEMLELAAEAEATRRAMSFTDPAINYFIKEEVAFLRYAELVEKRQRYIGKVT